MRSLQTQLISGVLFPIQEYLKKHTTVEVTKKLEASQWLPPDRIKDIQLARLKALLVSVKENVPYYRQLFAELRFEPEAVTGLQDLSSLPFLTKPIIRANLEAMKSQKAIRLSRFNTGGSSGEPLVFFIGAERVSHDVAAKRRATRWWGVDIGDPEIVVWGSPIELGSQDRIRQWRDALMRTELLRAFEMSPQKLDRFIERIRARKPRMLFGYPSALSHIARHAESKGIAMNDIGIQVAYVTSERLYDEQRATISRVFGCPVANGYGGRDAGFIAHECPSGGMHITAEDIVLEIVDTKGQVLPKGQSGEIVVTHLATSDFPFIRYRTGDIGVLSEEQCACGRGLPLLKEIQGRSTDFVVAHDGTVMHGLSLIYVLRDLPGIGSFKIVQESIERTRVLVVKANGYEDSVATRIINGLKQRLGSEVEIVVETVNEIPPEKSGKFRYVVSHVVT